MSTYKKFNFLFFFLIAGFLSLAGTVSFAQSDSGNQYDSLAIKIKTFFGVRSENAPGAVLIISKNGKELYNNHFGKSNLELGTDITEETVFEAASVTKQFTAAAILLLAADGKLDIMDDVHEYIPELPDYGVQITLQNLLTHTSGLKDWRNVTYITPLSTSSRLFDQNMALEMICNQTSLNFLPGDQYRYSNTGYDLLGTIVERVSGQPFAQFVKDRLLTPAEMYHSYIGGKYTDIEQNRATGYRMSAGKYQQGFVLDETYGAAGLLTTASDLQKWNEYIFSNKVSNNFRKIRTTQFVLNDGTEIPYACGGVEVHRYNGQTEIHHGGLISGYRAWVAYYPGKNISVTYMSNDRSISTKELSGVINEALFGKDNNDRSKKVYDTPVKELLSLAGVYLNRKDSSIYLRLNFKDGKLFHRGEEVIFTGKGKFILGNMEYAVKGNSLIKMTPTGDFKFVKEGNPDNLLYPLSSYTGNYYSKDAGVGLHFVVKDQKLYANRSSHDQIPLTPLFQDGSTTAFLGFTNGLRALFYFKKNGNNSFNLKVSLPRADNIPFINTQNNP